VAARDRLARRATRSRAAVPWQVRSRRDLRCGKAEASDAELLRKDRRCVAGLLREMQEHDGIDPNYATVIFGGAGVAVSKMQLRCSMKCWPRKK
jgi:hypothetical protein